MKKSRETKCGLEFEQSITRLAKYIKPRIKSASDLTDEEWLFVFGENKNSYHINRFENSVVVCFNGFKASEWDNEFDFNQKVFEYCDQQMLNRLYSLHVSLEYEE